jgi:hypothetical protein
MTNTRPGYVAHADSLQGLVTGLPDSLRGLFSGPTYTMTDLNVTGYGYRFHTDKLPGLG